jgi:signal peptidase II
MGGLVMNKVTRLILLILVVAGNVGCDQVTKNLAREQLDYGSTISIIDPFLTLVKVENTGAFLSLGNGLPESFRVGLLIFLPCLILIIVFIYAMRSNNISRVGILGLGFIVGGGVGNMIDRILFGSVTDFLHMDFVLFRTGIFNAADVSIMVGMFLLLLQSFFQMSNSKSVLTDN